MKFDVNVLRYIEKDAWRVLVSVEMGMKNHELVPVELVSAISGLKHGGAYKYIRDLLKHKLVHHDNQKYDGYRLTPLGYDFLAIKAFVNRGAIAGERGGRQNVHIVHSIVFVFHSFIRSTHTHHTPPTLKVKPPFFTRRTVSSHRISRLSHHQSPPRPTTELHSQQKCVITSTSSAYNPPSP